MSDSYDFRHTSRFTVGTVGEPGDRTFFLQIGDPYDTVSLKMEKGQVQALAQFFGRLLDDLPAPAEPATAAAFMEPPFPDWTVGQIAVGIDDSISDTHLLVVVEELVIGEESVANELLADLDDLDDPEDRARLQKAIEALMNDGENEGATVRAHISVEQAAAFIEVADDLVRRGRPPCRLCGQPRDPNGHFCPRLN